MSNYIGIIPNPEVRDFQRKKLYDAEDLCTFWNHLNILSLEEINLLIKNIAAHFVIKPPMLITEGHGSSLVAYATATELVLPFPIAKSLPFICHEMSHVINYQHGPADHHGPNFATTYLLAVKNFMGLKAYSELLYNFADKKIKYNFDVEFALATLEDGN